MYPNTYASANGPWLSEWRYMSSSTASLTGVQSFGDLGITSLNNAFRAAPGNFTIPNSIPSTVTRVQSMFQGAASFNQPLNSWNMSNVTDMSSMFREAGSFNQELNSWDTSSVTTMYAMFQDASSFNQALDLWDISNVTSIGRMFYGASSFNQALNSWDTSKVTNMSYMFYAATVFNQDLSSWCVSLIASRPTGFDSLTPDWVKVVRQPPWGSCF